ncbi:Sel1 repeat containing protein, putative [Babesia ovata]|uniref:Sel1 repeat containing protein, putative n=1 Tax=Babesia ovata TaxID=189622 RepID=A0A2H6KGY3_9APIC|nr:Sel1 repeat containing protein, putative [Babesia ovata]GBE62252.1 Sel1 repeat containing protein, putative [Babesia ovata]
MLVNVRHVLAAAVLIPAIILSADAPYYLQDTPTKDVLLRAYAVATVGMMRHCVKVLEYIERRSHIRFDSDEANDAKLMFDKATDAAHQVAYLFGVSKDDLDTSKNKVSDMEVVLKEKKVPQDLDFADIFKRVQFVLERCTMFGQFVAKVMREKSKSKHFEIDFGDIDDKITIEFPKIWIGPLHMVYKSMNINSSSIEPGQILGTRLQLWGAREFGTTAASVDRLDEHITWYYPQLFNKCANDLIVSMWNAIVENSDEENRTIIAALNKLANMNEAFRIDAK